MKLDLRKNVGQKERYIRIGAGAALLLSTEFIGPLGLLGIIPLLTGLFGSCPVYTYMGKDTTCGDSCGHAHGHDEPPAHDHAHDHAGCCGGSAASEASAEPAAAEEPAASAAPEESAAAEEASDSEETRSA